jgi:hypothetical protein
VIVGLLALGGGVAIAAQQQSPEPKVDRSAAEKAALEAVPGEVREIELEREGGAAGAYVAARLVTRPSAKTWVYRFLVLVVVLSIVHLIMVDSTKFLQHT